MNKELCFYINTTALFLDRVLVSFNETPIFFVCCDDDRRYYIVLCTDIENLEYIIVKQSISNIYKMLTQKIDMRTLFTDTDEYWNVKAMQDVADDEVFCCSISSLDQEVLPYAGEVYEAMHEDDYAYIDKISNLVFSGADYTNMPVPKHIEASSNIILGSLYEKKVSVSRFVDIGPDSGSLSAGVRKVFEYGSIEKHRSYIYSELLETYKTVPIEKSHDFSSSSVGVNGTLTEAA